MTKLVIIRLDAGNFKNGFPVTLEIGEDNSRPSMVIQGYLPPMPEMLKHYENWQLAYRQLGLHFRELQRKTTQIKNVSITQDCRELALILSNSLNVWLNSETFRPVKEGLIKYIPNFTDIRIVIQTDNLQLRQLPWHLWKILATDYHHAEISFSPVEYEQLVIVPQPNSNQRVKILVILGESSDIQVQNDLNLLTQKLPDAEIFPLINPQIEQLSNELWQQHWDILFFAGHSSSQFHDGQGRLYINERESLTIDELKFALRNAIAHGLQLAIFNSCDGLLLAQQLEDLHLPASIVMRERIADEAAQKFLEYFLEPFREQGKSLYLCVREARERLQSLEYKYPCASWLPVICSHPAAETITWQRLGGIPPCPYRGLAAFQEQDQSVFYGREAFTQQLLIAVTTKKLVAVIGASGSGKSSAVFAGLIPRLRSQTRATSHIKIAWFRPGNDPFEALATAMVSVTSNFPEILSPTPTFTSEQQLIPLQLAQELQQHPDVLTRTMENIIQSGNCQLLLVADQFEELYTLVGEAERLLLLDGLLKAVNHVPGFTLVLTLRADFCGRVLEYQPLAQAFHQYAPEFLIPMNREELQQAIALPAQQTGVNLESGLVERIINDIHLQPGKLPLLEFALTELWTTQQQGILSLKAYADIGGVEKALANHAERVYLQLSEVNRQRAKQIFIQLIQPGEGTEDTRRIATRTEIGEDNWDLVVQLASARLVVTGRDESKGCATVEIVHEALIRSWRELTLWIQQNRDFRTWQERLRMAILQWQKSGYDQEALLRGFLLTEAEDWLQQRQTELSPDEQNFIEISVNQRNSEQQAKEQQRQAKIAALTSSLVLALSLAGIACWQWQRAEWQKQLIEITAIQAFSENLLLSGKEFEALLASLKAAKLLQKFHNHQDTRIQVAATLQQALYKVRESNRLEGHTGRVMSVSWSGDGETIASAGFDKVAKIWRSDGTLLNTLSGHTDTVFSVAFSPDGQLIATASFDQTVKIWNVNGSLVKTIIGHSQRVLGVAWSPDGKTIATASEDQTVKLWKLDGTLIKTFVGHTDTVFSVTFSPDGQTIASAGWDNTAKLWDLDGNLLQTLTGHTDQVDSVAFSPDGNLIATASADLDKTIKLWRRDRTQGIYTIDRTLPAHQDTIYSVKFSPDGNTLASGSKDGTIKLWHRQGELKQTLIGHTNSVNSISFSPDGKSIASASGDGSVKIWQVAGAMPMRLQSTGKPVLAIGFSPNGQHIVTTEQEGKIRLWRTNGQQQLEFGDEQTYISVAFSHDGETIATAGKDNSVKIWERDGTFIQALPGHTARVFDLSFSPDNDLIATASAENTVKIWRTDGTLVRTIPAHDDEVLAVAWSPDGKTLASGSSDRTVKLWNIAGELLSTMRGHSDRIMSIAWSPDGKTIASASQDNTIKLWGMNGQLLHTLKGHTDIINSVKFHPNGQSIVSVSEDSTVRFWNLEGSLLATLRGHNQGINSVSFSPDGQIVASAGNDGIVILWSLNLNQLTTRACHWVRHYLQTNPTGQLTSHICDI